MGKVWSDFDREEKDIGEEDRKKGNGDGGQKGKKEKEENPRVRSAPRGSEENK